MSPSVSDPQLRALRRRVVPAWWSDAKLGIMVHWTPASVPGFAPTDVGIGELLTSGEPDALSRTPYAEWYENSLRFPDSPVARHHREVYGTRPYTEFARDWEAGLEGWDPDGWAAHFARTGARYVVFVAKHGDGYCLWPTEVENPHRSRWSSRRDVVGEMAEAVRAAGMRFGIYYCGGFDWSFEQRPVGSIGDTVASIPRGDYPAYATAQVRELIARYRPSVLWGDVAWPAPGRELWPLFAEYYAQVPDGVVNDRWVPWNPMLAAARWKPARQLIDAGARRGARRAGGLVPPKPPYFDVRTPEYVSFAEPQRIPFECVRGMDRSFGYNAASRAEDFISREDLLWQMVDTVAKGGNLLLNVGPRGRDAQIPDEQLARLGWLADWAVPHRSAIIATRPWVTPGATTTEHVPVRYTTRDGRVFAFFRGASGPVTLTDVRPTPTTVVESPNGQPLQWRPSATVAGGLTLDLRPTATPAEPTVVTLRNVEAAPPPT
jgi:alpha-L-fucosidase